MAIGGGEVVSPTAALLTTALLLCPPLLVTWPWLRERTQSFGEKWQRLVERLVPLSPLLLILLALIFRIDAVLSADGRDSHVAAWLPEGVGGAAAIPYIFAGEAGAMFGVLLGFAAMLAWRTRDANSHDSMQVRAVRWAALAWVVLLGWGTPSDAFSISVASSALPPFGSVPEMFGLDMVLLGALIVHPLLSTIARLEIHGMRFASKLRLGSALVVGSVAMLISQTGRMGEGVAMLALGITLVGVGGHLIVSMKIYDLRGQGKGRKWTGLLRTFVHSILFIVIGTAWVAWQDPAVASFHNALWETRYISGWVLMCGLVGAMAPMAGFDSRPRPEAWGWHSGTLFSIAIFPGLPFASAAFAPVFLAATTVPILATHPEKRPRLAPTQRIIESILIIAAQILLLYTWVGEDGLLLMLGCWSAVALVLLHRSEKPPSSVKEIDESE